MNMGILGIVFFLVSWLPHGILYLAALALLLLVDRTGFITGKSMAAAAGMGDGSCGTGTSWMCIGGVCWNPAVTFCCRKIIKKWSAKGTLFTLHFCFQTKNCLLCVHLRNVIDQLFGIFPSETRSVMDFP